VVPSLPGASGEVPVKNAAERVPAHKDCRILALDTASGQCSAALLLGDQLLERSVRTAREHAQLLLPMVDELLAEAGKSLRELDGIAFGCGPGSFTGLRIAASVTQGLAAGADLPVLPVSDLRALAESVRVEGVATGGPSGWLLACMDARMGELYWGMFESVGQPVRLAAGGERLSGPARLIEEVRALLPADTAISGAAGMGLRAYPELMRDLGIDASLCLPQAEPHAREIARLASLDLAQGAPWQDAATAQPVYIRNSVARAPL
jgi:tRNA threonylcarbamoyladenosine biosynthesis protein TsaB